MNKVSVIIPTYNGARFISRALTSVMTQTHTNVEVIVIDDGSTDQTKSIIEDFLTQFPGKIKYAYQPNSGVSKSRNHGFNLSQGDYIAFLDVDDEWLPTKLESQIKKFEADQKVMFVYCNVNFINEERKVLNDYVRKISLHRGNIACDLFVDFFIITSSLIIKRSCLDEVGHFDEYLKVGEDHDFILRLARKYTADVVEEKLVNRVVRADSLSRQDYALDAHNDLKILKLFVKNNPDFYRIHKKKVHKRLGDYHFVFGYQLLEKGRNIEAALNFFYSMCYQPSFNIFKNLCLCVIPYQMRTALKHKNQH